jgi:hypothetical protein
MTSKAMIGNRTAALTVDFLDSKQLEEETAIEVC